MNNSNKEWLTDCAKEKSIIIGKNVWHFTMLTTDFSLVKYNNIIVSMKREPLEYFLRWIFYDIYQSIAQLSSVIFILLVPGCRHAP